MDYRIVRFLISYEDEHDWQQEEDGEQGVRNPGGHGERRVPIKGVGQQGERPSGLPLILVGLACRYAAAMDGAQQLKTQIPDLRDVPLDDLAQGNDLPSGLAAAIALYRERLKRNGVPLSSFNARI